jgi:hypothetical protein
MIVNGSACPVLAVCHDSIRLEGGFGDDSISAFKKFKRHDYQFY